MSLEAAAVAFARLLQDHHGIVATVAASYCRDPRPVGNQCRHQGQPAAPAHPPRTPEDPPGRNRARLLARTDGPINCADGADGIRRSQRLLDGFAASRRDESGRCCALAPLLRERACPGLDPGSTRKSASDEGCSMLPPYREHVAQQCCIERNRRIHALHRNPSAYSSAAYPFPLHPFAVAASPPRSAMRRDPTRFLESASPPASRHHDPRVTCSCHRPASNVCNPLPRTTR